MSETILRALTPTPSLETYTDGLQALPYPDFTLYAQEQDGRRTITLNSEHARIASNIRFVDGDTAKIVVDPHQLSEHSVQSLIWGALGKSIDEQAHETYVAPSTVKSHRSNLFQKLGTVSMTEAVRSAFGQGILQPADTPVHKLQLTNRQQEVLECLSHGVIKDEAAFTLGLSVGTIKTHTQAILGRNKLRNVTHAVTMALLSRQI